MSYIKNPTNFKGANGIRDNPKNLPRHELQKKQLLTSHYIWLIGIQPYLLNRTPQYNMGSIIPYIYTTYITKVRFIAQILICLYLPQEVFGGPNTDPHNVLGRLGENISFLVWSFRGSKLTPDWRMTGGCLHWVSGWK